MRRKVIVCLDLEVLFEETITDVGIGIVLLPGEKHLGKISHCGCDINNDED